MTRTGSCEQFFFYQSPALVRLELCSVVAGFLRVRL